MVTVVMATVVVFAVGVVIGWKRGKKKSETHKGVLTEREREREKQCERLFLAGKH